jgi:type II secretory pathway component PulF
VATQVRAQVYSFTIIAILMSQVSIAPVFAFHGQVMRLASTGLPIDLGLCSDGSPSSLPSLQSAMTRVEDVLRLRVGLGQPLPEAIAEAPELTPRYRALLLAWLDAEEPSAVLDSLTHAAQDRVRLSRELGVSLIEPMLLMLLTFAAFALLCTTTVPRFEAIYAQLWKKPPGVLAALIVLRDSMPIWIIVVPIILAMFWFWLMRRGSISSWRWFPGGKRYLESLRYATFADQVATLVNRGVTIDHSMMLADAELAASLKADPDSAPPLLRWAISGDVGNEPRQNVFHFVATSYRQIAEHRSLGLRLVLPAVLISIIGGTLVFVFGISLFMPMVDLMKQIALPGGA